MTLAPGGGVAADLYLELLSASLVGAIERDGAFLAFRRRPPDAAGAPSSFLKTDLPFDVELDVPYDEAARAEGLDWPRHALSMIGRRRMDNLRHCLETALADRVPGDFIETGVFRGGACIFARGVLKAHGADDRRVFVADSFRGLPPPDVGRYPADADFVGLWRQVARIGLSQPRLEDVRSAFERYGLLDEQVRFLVGWFRETLPSAPIERLAVMRLDGDMYESTRDALCALYPRLSPGGFVIVDDYAIDACRQAVTDFRREQRIEDALTRIDAMGAFWRRAT